MTRFLLLLLLPSISHAEPWHFGFGLAVARDGTPGRGDHPNPAAFESDDTQLRYGGITIDAARDVTRWLRFRYVATGGKIDSGLGVSGWFVGAGVGFDARICTSMCFGVGITATEQFLDYTDNNDNIQFPAGVIQPEVFTEIALAEHVQLAIRIGPRWKWVHSTLGADKYDPQPGLGGGVVLVLKPDRHRSRDRVSLGR